MRTPESFVIKSPVPVYAVALPRSDALLYAGGGGVSRSGVANVIRSGRVRLDAKAVDENAEIKLSSTEDAPMCLAVSLAEDGEREDDEDEETETAKTGSNGDASTKAGAVSSIAAPIDRKIVVGINSTIHASGINQNLRLFHWKSSSDAPRDKPSDAAALTQRIESVANAESVRITDAEVYIRSAVVSPNGQLLAVGSTDGQMALHKFPSLERLWLLPGSSDTSIADVTFSADSALVAFVTPSAVQIYPTTSAKAAVSASGSGGDASTTAPPELYQSIRNPSLKGSAGCVFRAACFGRTTATRGGTAIKSSRLYTVVNTTPPAGLGSSKKDREKAKIRKCFVSAWDTDSWTVLQTRQISERPATVAVLSDNGKHLAVSTSDLTVHLLSSLSLKTVWQIRDAHAFPGTCLAFSPRGDVLVSGSADMSMRVARVGEHDEPASGSIITTLLDGKLATVVIALLLVLLAWYAQAYLTPGSVGPSQATFTSSSSSTPPPIPAAPHVHTTSVHVPTEL